MSLSPRAPDSDPVKEFGAPDAGPERLSSSSIACTLALSSGRRESFSSIANVVTEAMLFESKLVGFVDELERCVRSSSKEVSRFRAPFSCPSLE
jgi:hypothetical protein